MLRHEVHGVLVAFMVLLVAPFQELVVVRCWSLDSTYELFVLENEIIFLSFYFLIVPSPAFSDFLVIDLRIISVEGKCSVQNSKQLETRPRLFHEAFQGSPDFRRSYKTISLP